MNGPFAFLSLTPLPFKPWHLVQEWACGWWGLGQVYLVSLIVPSSPLRCVWGVVGCSIYCYFVLILGLSSFFEGGKCNMNVALEISNNF